MQNANTTEETSAIGSREADRHVAALPVLGPKGLLLDALTVAGPSSKVEPAEEAGLPARLKAALADLF